MYFEHEEDVRCQSCVRACPEFVLRYVSLCSWRKRLRTCNVGHLRHIAVRFTILESLHCLIKATLPSSWMHQGHRSNLETTRWKEAPYATCTSQERRRPISSPFVSLRVSNSGSLSLWSLSLPEQKHAMLRYGLAERCTIAGDDWKYHSEKACALKYPGMLSM